MTFGLILLVVIVAAAIFLLAEHKRISQRPKGDTWSKDKPKPPTY